jgi:small GTP-binding protein
MERELKIVFLGESTVGKTSIITSFSQSGLISDVEATIGACFSVQRLTIGSSEVKLKIWDTAGQERFRALTPMYFRDADVALLVFAVNSADTFQKLDSWLADVRHKTTNSLLIFIVGNKTDLGREVDTADGIKFAKQIGAIYAECSAKTKDGIGNLFRMAAMTALDLDRGARKPVPLILRALKVSQCC